MFDQTAPPEILTALREIDEDADLVHLGGGLWLLGVRAPNPAAQAALREEILGDPHGVHRRREERENPGVLDPIAGKRLELLQFYARGFKPIHMYECERPTHEIVEDFRRRNHNWLTRPEAAFGELKDEVNLEAANERRTDVLREFLHAEMPFLWHHVMRRARRFAQRVGIPGVN